MKHLWTAIGLMFFAACSNPFSGDRADGQRFHTPNQNCQELRLDADRLNPADVRAMVHCLNSDKSLAELEALLDEIPDKTLSPMSDLLNRLLHEDVKSFYSVREIYQQLKSKNLLGPILSEIRQVEDYSPLSPLAQVVSELLFDPHIQLRAENLRHYLQSSVYKRLVNEHPERAQIDTAVQSLKRYLDATPSYRFQGLLRLLTDSRLSRIQDQKQLTALASFFETIFDQQRFSDFSKTLGLALEEPIRCFDRSLVVTDPIWILTQKIIPSSPDEARTLLDTRARTMIMTARGYCDMPYSFDPIFRFTDPLIAHPGYEASYRELYPLIKNPEFARFLALPSAREWSSANRFLADRHTMQDLFTLIYLNQDLPLTNDATRAAQYLDRTFLTLTETQALSAAHAMAPFVTSTASTPLLDAYLELPPWELRIDDAFRARLRELTRAVIASPRFGALAPMVRRLIDQNKIVPVWDQVFALFQATIVKGRHVVPSPAPVKLASKTANWKSLLIEPLAVSGAPSACSLVSTDYAFTATTIRKSGGWSSLDACFGKSAASRSIVKTGKAFSDELLATGRMQQVISIETDLINSAFKLDPMIAMNLLTDFVDLSQRDSDTVKKAVLNGSRLANAVMSPLLKATKLRSILADGVQDPRLYRGLVELRHAEGAPKMEAPLDFGPYTVFDTWAIPTQKQLLPLVTGIQRMMQEYCPSLDIANKDCDIDDDQVALYRQHAEQLARQIIDESIHRPESWIHPILARDWTHTGPDSVQDFEYHFHPLLHELRASGGVGRAVVNFFSQYKGRAGEIQRFIRDSGRHYTLIPYYYQVPGFPKSGKRQFHTRIRIRLASDLDRLELVAINTDFRPLGIVRNMGLKFIHQIGVSWGDEPSSNRPAGTTSETLAQTTADIHNFIHQIDREALRKLGECDPRGKTRIGRWIQGTICNGDIADLSARIFNLRYLAQFFDEMQVREAGGNDGMRILRNLFYALSSTNSSQQRERYGDGAEVDGKCLAAPGSGAIPEECQLDQLTLVSRVTRLGLLHQAGLTAALNPASSYRETIALLVEISTDPGVREQLADWIGSPQSTRTLVSLKDWIRALPDAASPLHLHQVLRLASELGPYHWVSGALSALQADPLLLEKFSKPLRSWLVTPIRARETFSPLKEAPQARAWLRGRLNQIDEGANRELSTLIRALSRQPDELDAWFRQNEEIEGLHSRTLPGHLDQALLRLASDEARSQRVALRHYLISPDFDTLCDVISDTQLVGKTYNFLEKIHQNPDSAEFFANCRAFLFR